MDWMKERDAVLTNARRIVVKVGSAVLTGPDGLDENVVRSLARQIAGLHAQGRDVVLVSSGAVAAGRGAVAHLSDLGGLPERQAASAVGQGKLMHAYDEAFASHGIVPAQVLLTRDDLQSRRRFLNARNTFSTLLRWRSVPIVNENDTVSVRELEFGDNDCLASLLLNVVEADLFVNLTSARGVFGENPDTNPHAECLSVIEDIDGFDLDGICDGKTAVGSGGMYSKLLAARRVAQLGAPTLIIPGRESDALSRVFDGECLGTWVCPAACTIPRRKFWLAYNAKPSGSVTVDAGARRALTERGKSLLPAGVVAVEGSFQRGALIRILSVDGDPLGVGLCNYSASALRRILGRRSNEVEEILGYTYNDAVHRDNMLLDAAY